MADQRSGGAPAVEITTTTRGFNLLPFAAMAGGWLGPLLMFWLAVWGPLRPFEYESGDLVLPTYVLLLCVAAVSALPLALPPGYYRPRPFERSPGLYRALGVHWFRRVVPDGDVANRRRRSREPGYRVVRSRRFVQPMWNRTVEGERSHLVLLVFGAGSAALAAVLGWMGWAAYLTAGNILVNLYPILLQRYTRARLEPLLRGAQGRTRYSPP